LISKKRENTVERTIKPEDLKVKMASRGVTILLDVRRKADYDVDKNTLPNALWRDPEKVDEWSREPCTMGTSIYCARIRSATSARPAAGQEDTGPIPRRGYRRMESGQRRNQRKVTIK
jgi:hypothetical protein